MNPSVYQIFINGRPHGPRFSDTIQNAARFAPWGRPGDAIEVYDWIQGRVAWCLIGHRLI